MCRSLGNVPLSTNAASIHRIALSAPERTILLPYRDHKFMLFFLDNNAYCNIISMERSYCKSCVFTALSSNTFDEKYHSHIIPKAQMTSRKKFRKKENCKVRGLSKRFVDTAWLCCFLNIVQINVSYFDCIKHEWIIPKTNWPHSHIHTITVAMTTQGKCLRSTPKYRQFKCEIVYLYYCCI